MGGLATERYTIYIGVQTGKGKLDQRLFAPFPKDMLKKEFMSMSLKDAFMYALSYNGLPGQNNLRSAYNYLETKFGIDGNNNSRAIHVKNGPIDDKFLESEEVGDYIMKETDKQILEEIRGRGIEAYSLEFDVVYHNGAGQLI